jgi:hypothetical protein
LHEGDYAREEFELKDDRKAIAAEGGALSRILDVEFLSRAAPPCKQWGNPLSVFVCLYLVIVWRRAEPRITTTTRRVPSP